MRMMKILSPWVKRLCVFSPFYFFTFLPLSAQTFTQNIQQTKQGEGKVTIHQDAAIDKLVNAPEVVRQENNTPRHDNKDNKDNKPVNGNRRQNDSTEQQNRQQTPPVQQEDSTLTQSRRAYKTSGYRVQVYAGGNTRRDRQKAERTGRSLEQLFPGDAVYVHFYSPRWICRMGNYRTYEEAHEKMLEVRKLGYSSATVVRGTIITTQ